MKKVLFIFGTRPEGIKMAPLIKELQKHPDKIETKILVTGQHKEMLGQVMDFFGINSDYDLKIMTPKQTIFDVTVKALSGFQRILSSYKPDLIFVQGDTTTVLAGALAGYYSKTDVAHLEAGLRSGNIFSPYPEEGNRILAGHLAKYHFAPTQKAVENLKNENIKENIWNVGNTVIDALILGLKIIEENGDEEYRKYFDFVDFSKKLILVTGHRRESFGRPFEEICEALVALSKENEDIEIVYPVHLNPNVQEPVHRILGEQKRIHLIEPLSYPYLIWLLNKTYFVLTDSGGIQEEAPTLGKPVLVMREVTERVEGIEAGTAMLVGTDSSKILKEAQRLLDDMSHYESMAHANNPYGNGDTSQKIVQILFDLFSIKE